jgi:hypothetical protein
MNCMSKALQNHPVDSCSQSDSCKAFVGGVCGPPQQRQRPAFSWFLTEVQPFLKWEYCSTVLDQLDTVSPNACRSNFYASVDILSSFQQNVMQQCCSNTSTSLCNGQTPHTRLKSSCYLLLWYVTSDLTKYHNMVLTSILSVAALSTIVYQIFLISLHSFQVNHIHKNV